MSFPYNDQYWVDTANFVREHLQSNERVIAPKEFSEVFPGKVYDYSLLPLEIFNSQWVIMYKGMIDETDFFSLRHLKNRFNFVFANEVFVVFSNSEELCRLPFDDINIIYFLEKTKKYDNTFTTILYTIKLIMKYLCIILLNYGEDFMYILKYLSSHENRNINPNIHRDSVYIGSNKVLTTTVWGHKIIVDSQDISLSPHIILSGLWEIELTNVFMQNIKENMCVIDIGANIGYYTLIAASKVGIGGKVYSFEANPHCCEILFQNIAINGFGNIVSLIDKAVIDKSGKIMFHRLKKFLGGSSVHKFSEETLRELHDEYETLEVEAISLDEYFTDNNLIVDLIKIDAEGSEPLIFRGMNKIVMNNPQIKIICEFSPRILSGSGINPISFLEEIVNYGFKLRIIDLNSSLVNISSEELLKASSHYNLFLTR
jgi:FkbM family methyltransferase